VPGDDVIRRARIREVAQAVFPASQLGAALVGYIRRPFSAEFSSVRRASQLGAALVGYIRRPFSAEFSSVRRASQLRKFSESSVSQRE
jgi:hypothetical protein